MPSWGADMTLRDWIASVKGRVATEALLEQFEHEQVEAHANVYVALRRRPDLQRYALEFTRADWPAATWQMLFDVWSGSELYWPRDVPQP